MLSTNVNTMPKKEKKYKFQFNAETLSFEKVETSVRSTLKTIFLHIFSSTFIGIAIFLTFFLLVDSPEEKQLKDEKKALETQYKLLSKQVDEMADVIADLEQRDDNLYRVIFQADPIADQVRHNSQIGNNRYEEMAEMGSSKIMAETTEKVDRLKRQLYIQSKSYDEITELLKLNTTKLQYIPAIQPLLNKDLTRVASGFGRRIDPIYGTPRMHNGMDFTAPTGTDIYATGNGTVTYAGWKQGYGNTIIIDHGFGYETVYAHLHKIKVRRNQKVKRAEIIGTVGSTGKSTGPHLHYEVIFKGRYVDPLNYYFIDLTPEEYDRMIQLAANAGQVMD